MRQTVFAICCVLAMHAAPCWANDAAATRNGLQETLADALASGAIRSKASVERFYAQRRYRPGRNAENPAVRSR